MSNKGVIDTGFDPEELVREALNPSFALLVTEFQREVLAFRERLGPRLLQALSNLLNDGVDTVTAILAVKQQDLHQFKRKEAQIRKEARAEHGRKGGATARERGEKTGSEVRAKYPDALIEVRKSHGGKRFHGDHGIAVKMIAKELDISVPTVGRHLKGLGPRPDKASE